MIETNGLLIRVRMLYNALIVAASVVAGVVSGLSFSLLIIAVLVVGSMALTYVEQRQAQLRPESDSLEALIEENVLEDVVTEYGRMHDDAYPPEVRANVMFLRRRNTNPLKDNRQRPDVRSWERTLRLEASCGDYETTAEDELEWKTDEGVVGRAMNESAQEIWAKLDYDDGGRIQEGWNLTDAQTERTSHIESLLCVPIYLPSDEEKSNPIGVLNLDCEADLSESCFGDESIREKMINSANIIGGIVE